MSIERRVITGSGKLQYTWDVTAPGGCVVRSLSHVSSGNVVISVSSKLSAYKEKVPVAVVDGNGSISAPVYCDQDDVLHFEGGESTAQWVMRIVVEKI